MLKCSARNCQYGKSRDLPRELQIEAYDQQLRRTRPELAKSFGMANPGQKLLMSTAGVGRDQVRGLLKVCEALRDHFRAYVRKNASSWESGDVTPKS
jgi:hypothetical protein